MSEIRSQEGAAGRQPPDDVLVRLEAAGFRVGIEGESFVVSLENRPVRRREVAETLDCETSNLEQLQQSVRVSFGAPAA